MFQFSLYFLTSSSDFFSSSLLSPKCSICCILLAFSCFTTFLAFPFVFLTFPSWILWTRRLSHVNLWVLFSWSAKSRAMRYCRRTCGQYILLVFPPTCGATTAISWSRFLPVWLRLVMGARWGMWRYWKFSVADGVIMTELRGVRGLGTFSGEGGATAEGRACRASARVQGAEVTRAERLVLPDTGPETFPGLCRTRK